LIGERDAVLHWEPGGTRLAGRAWRGQVWIYEVGGQGDLRVLDSTKTGWITSIEWAPVGITLGMGTDAGDIVLWDCLTDTLDLFNADHAQLVSGIAWSPDGSFVASSSWDGSVQIFVATGGARARVLTGMGASLDGIAWSPDGGLVALRSWYGMPVTIWDSTTWARVATAEGTSGTEYSSIRWSPDGNYLMLASAQEIVVWRRPGDSPEVVVPQADTAAWSPDSKMLAVGSKDRIEIYSAPDWEPAFVLEGHSGPVDWSPDGVYLAARRSEGGASVLGIPR
jgi:WD40 repeat protein